MRDDDRQKAINLLHKAGSRVDEGLHADAARYDALARDILVAALTPRADAYAWKSIEEDGPRGVGGQVWVAYPNPNHPDGWTLRIQWTPIQTEIGISPPLFWCGVHEPSPPPPTELD